MGGGPQKKMHEKSCRRCSDNEPCEKGSLRAAGDARQQQDNANNPSQGSGAEATAMPETRRRFLEAVNQEQSSNFGIDVQNGHPQDRRLQLVTEKSLNMHKFSGEQDKGKNKIHYYKWQSQITDFIESKGRAGAALHEAMK